ncbi:MAG: Holliday junction branch migration protein RuvA [Patescibacteria group bacterium]
MEAIVRQALRRGSGQAHYKMIYFLSGQLLSKKENFAVVSAGGIGYKVFITHRTAKNLPLTGSGVSLFSYLHVKEDALDLYGFLDESDLHLFEKLIQVNGVGPKTALGVMAISSSDNLIAAINEGKIDLLTRASGIGKKTGERIILELKGKLASLNSAGTVRLMESDLDLEEALVSLGYSKQQAQRGIAQLDSQIKGLETRLMAALKIIKSK